MYDAIILGAGGVGSAAAYHLARRGAKVLAIDRFPAGHDRGSSHGETRIIRQAYFEHPDYVPLLLRAYELWRELEQLTGVELLKQIGLLQIGPPEGMVVRGVLASAGRHGLHVEPCSAQEAQARWPAFRVPDDMVGVFEPAAGYLRVEACVLAHLAAAGQCGAKLKLGVGARSWHAVGGGVQVELESGERIAAGKLIIAAGSWAPQLLADLAIPLTIRRKHVYWYPTASPAYHQNHGCPTYLYELPLGVFYGFPQIDHLGLKVAEHSGGEVVDDPLLDPREPDRADQRRVEDFLAAYLPGVAGPPTRRSVCFYTMSPDEHFVIDFHPQHENVLFAAGLSGHGFKFTSVLGEALADLATAGTTDLPIGFLGLQRLAQTP